MLNSVLPLTTDDQITISMASIPERKVGMLKVVEQLLPYCDNFDICLNGYPIDYYPEVLRNPKITIIRQNPNIGARGKFYLAGRTPGYHIIVDDDIYYPDDCVTIIIQAIEKYRRKAIVGFHGHLLTFEHNQMYYFMLPYNTDLASDMPCHILATNLFGYHSDTINIDGRTMLEGKIDDQVAALAQDSGVPLMLLKHTANWIQPMHDLDRIKALCRNIPLREEAYERVKKRTWKLYMPNERIK